MKPTSNDLPRPRFLTHLWATAHLVVAAAPVVPALVAWVEGRAAVAGAFLAVSAACVAMGLLGRRAPVVSPSQASTGALLRTVAGLWLGLSLLAAVPFAAAQIAGEGGPQVQAAYPTVAHAWFEAMSGVTSTGLSTSPAASELPASLQLWRSLLQWLGGFSILIFVVASSGRHAARNQAVHVELAAELPDESPQQWARRCVAIYLAYTSIVLVGFLAAAMPPWEAVNHAMTAISTGGFSVRDDSFASYGPAIRGVALAASVVSALSWSLHTQLWPPRPSLRFARSTQHRLFAAWLAGGVTLAVLAGLATSSLSWGDIVFDTISAITTSGLTVGGSHADWPAVVLAVFIIVMVVGGSAGSTSGGIKQSRLAWLGSAAARLTRPANADAPYIRDGERVDDGVRYVADAAGLLMLWLATIAAASLTLAAAFPTEPAGRILFDVTSALGGVGLSAGFIGGDRPPWVLGMFSTLMWMGRLELIAVLHLVWARR